MAVRTIDDPQRADLFRMVERFGGVTVNGLDDLQVGPFLPLDPEAPEGEEGEEELFQQDLRAPVVEKLHGEMKRPAAAIDFPIDLRGAGDAEPEPTQGAAILEGERGVS